MLVEARLDALDEGVTLLPAQECGEVGHHLGIGVHRRERPAVPLEPATQYQALGADRRHAHSPGPKRRTAPRSSKASPGAHAISQRFPSGSAM